MRHVLLTLLLGALLLPGCSAQPTAAAGTARVVKAIGSLQCSGGGTPLPVLSRQLEDAGVTVIAARCGNDGRMHAARCGGADGRIGIFEIPASATPAAEKLGFVALAKLPDAQATPCP